MNQSYLHNDKKEDQKYLEVKYVIGQMMINRFINESERNYLLEALASENEGIINIIRNHAKNREKYKLDERLMQFLGKNSPKKNNFNPELKIVTKPIHEKNNHNRTHSETFTRSRLEEKKIVKTPEDIKGQTLTNFSQNERVLSALKNKKTVNSNFLLSQIYNEDVFFQKIENFLDRHLGNSLSEDRKKRLRYIKSIIDQKLGKSDDGYIIDDLNILADEAVEKIGLAVKKLRKTFPNSIDMLSALIENTKSELLIGNIVLFMLNSLYGVASFTILYENESEDGSWEIYNTFQQSITSLALSQDQVKCLESLSSKKLKVVSLSSESVLKSIVGIPHNSDTLFSCSGRVNEKRFILLYAPANPQNEDGKTFTDLFRNIEEKYSFDFIQNLSSYLAGIVKKRKNMIICKDNYKFKEIFAVRTFFLLSSTAFLSIKVRNILEESLGLKIKMHSKTPKGVYDFESKKEKHDVTVDFLEACFFCSSDSDSGKMFLKNEFTKIFSKVSLETVKLSEFMIQNYERQHFFANLVQDRSFIMDFDKAGNLKFMSAWKPDLLQNLHKEKGSGAKPNYSNIFKNNPELIENLAKLISSRHETKKDNFHETHHSLGKVKIIVSYSLRAKFNGFQIISDAKMIDSRLPTTMTELDDSDTSDSLDSALEQVPAATREIIQNKIKSYKVASSKIVKKHIDSIKKNTVDIRKSFLSEFLPQNSLEVPANERPFFSPNTHKRSSSPRKRFSQGFLLKYSGNSKEKEKPVLEAPKSLEIPNQMILNVFRFEKGDEDKMDDVYFDSLKLENILDKYRFIWTVFERNEFMKTFNIPLDNFSSFIQILSEKYNKRKNPFHNFDHGIAVMQSCHIMAKIVEKYYSSLEIFSLVFSGLCHDVSHRGYTNLFEIATSSKLAIRYHDKSRSLIRYIKVLEQHHTATTFKLLNKEKTNIFLNIKQDDAKLIRRLMISNILATDIKEHFNLLSKFESRYKELKEKPEIEFGKEEPDRILLTNMLLHTADFTATSKPWDSYKYWSLRVNKEFSNQYKMEGELKLPQTPYMKDLCKIEVLAKAEVGFLKAIVKPLWEILNNFLDNSLDWALTALNGNLAQWNELIEKPDTVTLQLSHYKLYRNKEEFLQELKEEKSDAESDQEPVRSTSDGEDMKDGNANLKKNEMDFLKSQMRVSEKKKN